MYAVHEYYGCDTGCCGHRVFVVDEHGGTIESEFHFDHPDENGQLYPLMETANKYGVPIDKEQCDMSNT